MTLKECYDALGGDFDEAMGRLRSERLVQKFVLKFLNDGSYTLLNSSFEQKDWGEAFRAAHTIKGVCQNLSFDVLGESSSELCEALRGGYTPQADSLVERVRKDYQRTVQAIQAYQEESGA